MKYSLFIIITFSILIVSCEDSQHATTIENQQTEIKLLRDSLSWMQDTINVLRTSRAGLVEELNRYKMSPGKIAINIEGLYREGNINELNRIARLLSKYHPESPEANRAEALINKYNEEQEAKKQAEKEAKMGALKKLKIKYDDVQHITWYYNNRFTHYNNTNHTSIYIGQHGHNGSTWLRLKMSYFGDDWIFFDRAYLSFDGNTREITFDKYKERDSDNGGGDVWEWIDVSVTPDMLAFLREMTEGKDVKMRLSGKYSHTRNLPANEVNAIREVILGYDLLNEPNN